MSYSCFNTLLGTSYLTKPTPSGPSTDPSFLKPKYVQTMAPGVECPLEYTSHIKNTLFSF